LGRTALHDDGVEAVLFDHRMDIFFTGSLDGFIRIFDSNKFTLKDKITVNVNNKTIQEDFNYELILPFFFSFLSAGFHNQDDSNQRKEYCRSCKLPG